LFQAWDIKVFSKFGFDAQIAMDPWMHVLAHALNIKLFMNF